MSIAVITRFTANPQDAEQLTARHAALVAATRASCPGPAEARLGRVDDESWVAIWRWESAEHLAAARASAPGSAEARAAFELAKDPTGEDVELVYEA
ncbi:antibiotic biosynthesis monooxygenase [Herbihabitans rhizosphaerae]|uniref:Antibiotic biosynthesis monooxygenase n=1 Tax=Herbihabitans rhizosphaerae TaxID=1872711 RepID=A0A4V2ESV3_9PSEU|nr:antibiotic biosynthesis monooxygenase [Herbihabitans rhizosphaerae]RZS38873.1 antibiotic biosynthesis monooxygenase [Herbihabitans rhizosphaerae]